MDYLKSLNEEQLKAAKTIDGRVFILAGAGSGKTATLVARTAYMVHNGIRPENILMLTFTKKATQEMQERVRNLIGDPASSITIKTFHGFCMKILFGYGRLTGINYDCEVIDNVQALEIMGVCKDTYIEEENKKKKLKALKKTTETKAKIKKEDVEIDLKTFPSKKVIFSYYAESTEKCEPLDTLLKGAKYSKAIKKIIKLYNKYKAERKMFDYEDMLRITEEKLRTNNEFRAAINTRFRYVSCDEYQDTNIIQNRILDLITEMHGNLTVVGDDNQSIYAFRFADVENILSFSTRYPDCKQIVLNKNYRSSQEILNLANSMMDKAPEGIKKELTGMFNDEKPQLIVCHDEFDEANFIIDQIRKRAPDEKLKDIAILCRNGFQSYVLEGKLNAADIPFQKFGGMKFTEKLAVRAVLAFLYLSENVFNESYLLTALRQYPSIGNLKAQEAATIIIKNGLMGLSELKKKPHYPYLQEFSTAIDRMSVLPFSLRASYAVEYYLNLMVRVIELKSISDSRKSEEYAYLEDITEDLRILENLASKFTDAVSFIKALSTDSVEPEADDYINISTIHSAKGLEYNTVFVLDCIDGVFPRKLEDYPEELRCMYVAITRAKKKLFVMFPQESCSVKCKGKISSFIDYKDVLETLNIV